MKYQDARKPTKYSSRDGILDIWNIVTELSQRYFGIKERKLPKEPSNFNQWSEESKEKWKKNNLEKIKKAMEWDWSFIVHESRIVDNICREIAYALDRATSMEINFLCDWQEQYDLYKKAIGTYHNLECELNHIASAIPSNKNFLTKLTDRIEEELKILNQELQLIKKDRDKYSN